MGSDGFQNPFLFGEFPSLQLRVNEIPVNGHLEATFAGRNQFQVADLLLVSRQQLARQTDGLRLIVSNRTILDLQVHNNLPSRSYPMC